MWLDQSNSRNIQKAARNQHNKSLFSSFSSVNKKREGTTLSTEKSMRMLIDHDKKSATACNLNDNENTTNADNGHNETIFSVETQARPTRSMRDLFSSLKSIDRPQAQPQAAAATYCGYGLLAFHVNDFKQQKFDLNDLFNTTNESIEHFTTDEKTIYKLLLMCIEKIIMTDAFTKEEKQKLRRNLYNNHFYLTMSVNDKTYKLTDENVSRYLRHCCRKQIVPHFFVHSLCALTRK